MQRTFPDGAGDERTVLTGWLDWQRATVRVKVEGLSEEDAHRSLVATSPRTTVAGLVSHLRWIERGWFSNSFPSVGGVRQEVPDGGWAAPDVSVAALLEEYEHECGASRRVVASFDLDAVQEFTPPEFMPVNLRWIVTHVIEETARHVGHLDILREHLDGTRGY